MAKRKTVQQKEEEAIVTKHLNELGRKVSVITGRNSKVSDKQKQHLRDSQNYRVKPYNVLIVTQNFYGKYNTPKGKATPKDRSNLKDTPLRNSIREFVPETTKVIVKDLKDMIISPVKLKK